MRLRSLDRQETEPPREEARVARRAARPSTFRFPEGESFTEMQLRMWTTLETDRGQAPQPHDRRREPRRSDQGRRHLRPGCAARPLPANGHLHLLDKRDRLHEWHARRVERQQHRFVERPRALVNYVFANPDKVMVGVRGEVGNRLFLLQVREGPTARHREVREATTGRAGRVARPSDQRDGTTGPSSR